MSGTRQLFSQAPIMPAAPVLPTVPPGSNLARAMMQPNQMNLQTPSMGVPLGSMLAMQQMMKQGQQPSGATSDNPNLIWNPNNPVGTDTLGGATANQGSVLGNAAAAYLPGVPTQGSPGMPSPDAPGPGMPSQEQPGMMGRIAAWIQSLQGGGGYPGPGGAYGGG